MPVRWDPAQYRLFADHRGRPFLDLLHRIETDDPRLVVDLGCGPGNLTALLAQRWPNARVLGLDSSPEMIDVARVQPGISATVGDVRSFVPDPDLDVLISNATLHWVPEHRDLLARWIDQMSSGAWLGIQVPGNFAAPTHRLMFELAESDRWSAQLAGELRHQQLVGDPIDYATLLLEHGWRADTWETTYVHLLTGPDPVLEWVRGTALRPILQALLPDDAASFEQEYAAALRRAYPPAPYGTLLPFRRIFAVGQKP